MLSTATGCGIEAERFLIESNRQREKTKVQRLREYKRLKEIETILAAERKKATLKKGSKKPDTPKLAERGEARKRAAEAVGLKPRTAEKGLTVLEKAESGDEKAKEALEAIDRGEKSVDRAFAS